VHAVKLLFMVGLLLVARQGLADERQDANSTTPSIFAELGLKPAQDRRLELQSFAAQQIAQCCKTCRKGKACGNSCISRSYTCNKPPGCACDATQ
jgi:hypothetical protein